MASKKKQKKGTDSRWWRKLTPDQRKGVDEAMEVLDSAVNFGDFALAHRLLVLLEQLAVGKPPDLSTLCEPRGVRLYTPRQVAAAAARDARHARSAVGPVDTAHAAEE